MYLNLTAFQLLEKLRNKKMSCVELTKHYLDRIKNIDNKIESFITVCEDEALKTAALADNEISKGDFKGLLGVPYAIKDNICTKDIKTTCGSKMLENFIPPYSATVVEKLTGLPLLGKLNMDEFGMGSSTENSHFKTTKNPFDFSRVPGGSSGGAAAAVAAGLTPFALASDTGGSVRQPASFCGCVGVKPTYGRVSRSGLIAYASSLDQIGVITNNVSDAALVLSNIAGYDQKDATTVKNDFCVNITGNIKGMRIGIPQEYFNDKVCSEVKSVVLNSIKILENIGAKCEQCSVLDASKALSAYYIIACAEASSNLARYDGIKYGFRESGKSFEDIYKKSRSQGFESEVKRRIMLGSYVLSSGFKDEYYKKALSTRRIITECFDKCFEKYDALITPTTIETAFEFSQKKTLSQMYISDFCTVAVNLAGLPAISIPCGVDTKGLPIGIQIITKKLDEQTMFDLAYALEQELRLSIMPKFRGEI